MFFFPN